MVPLGKVLGEGNLAVPLQFQASHRESCVLQAEISDADPQLVAVVTAALKLMNL